MEKYFVKWGRFNIDTLKQEDVLKFAVENNIIDITYVQDMIAMKKRKEILDAHCYSVWYSEKEDCWYTYIPDETKANKRKKIKKKKKADLESAICEYYNSHDENIKDEVERKNALSVEKLFYEFMNYKTQTVNGGTIRRMMADWNKFYKPDARFISLSVNKLTKIDIDDFFNSVLNKYDLKKKAFYNMCGILKQMLEYAVDAEYIEKNPYRVKVNKKKFASSSKKPSNKEVFQNDEREMFINEMERRLQNNPSNTAPLAVLLDFELGTRKGEILAISKSDIVGDRIHIHRQLVEEFDTSDLNDIKSAGFRIVDYTKSEDGDRWLPLTERAKEIIRRVEKINAENGFRYKDFLFVRENCPLLPDAIDAQIKRGCEYIGIPVKTMHKIRKTYASTLLHSGVNISIVKDMLGHADESTTLRHYVYNTESSDGTDWIVRNALEGGSKAPSDQSDQNIISFRTNKKAENPEKSRFPAI
ncbi:MAG: site-specific integrase [Lachnospiraceae bacterium]|nr:site-specific integrase [Lachnospiraceae bacterium]